MATRAIRSININMRTTSQEKFFLQKAAEIAGFSNLTNFIMTAARKEATRVLGDIHTTYLSSHDWETVKALLTAAPSPNKKLQQLLSRKGKA